MRAFKCELSDAGFLENIYRAFPFFTRNTGGVLRAILLRRAFSECGLQNAGFLVKIIVIRLLSIVHLSASDSSHIVEEFMYFKKSVRLH